MISVVELHLEGNVLNPGTLGTSHWCNGGTLQCVTTSWNRKYRGRSRRDLRSVSGQGRKNGLMWQSIGGEFAP